MGQIWSQIKKLVSLEIWDMPWRISVVTTRRGTFKCTHGCPDSLQGNYYASVFVHFKPQQDWVFDNEHLIAAVPPHWTMSIAEWRAKMRPKPYAALEQRKLKTEL